MLAFAGLVTAAVGTVGFTVAAIATGNPLLLIGIPVSWAVGAGMVIYAVNHTD